MNESSKGAHVVATNLSKSYTRGDNTVEVLSNINFELQPGQMAAIVGASGIGKSTLLHLLGTLDAPTTGKILINGQDTSTMSGPVLSKFRNNNIGFVFQFHHLLSALSALENVMLPILVSRGSKEEAHDRARALLEKVGLKKRLAHRPSELSGGEQQRVALARAMVLEPSLLLADEPTGNLDAATGQGIHELLVELNREHGSTMLVVTHNRGLAEMMPFEFEMGDLGALSSESMPTKNGELRA